MHFRNQDSTRWEKLTGGLHCLLGICLIAWSAMDLVKVSANGGSMLAMFGASLLAFGKGIFGVILLAPSMTRWALTPIFRAIDKIYYPGVYEKKPPLDYRLADYYRMTRQFDLAIERYSEIVRYYPDEATAHAWLFILAKETSPESGNSRKALRHARGNLKGKESWNTFRNLVTTCSCNDTAPTSQVIPSSDP